MKTDVLSRELSDSTGRRCVWEPCYDPMLRPAQEEQVRDYWSYCGEIEKLNVMRFPDTGRFKGIAFITFAEVLSLEVVGSTH